MARGNKIIVSANPRGVSHEGYINDTSKPGTIMQIDVSEGIGADGRFDFEAYNADADGDKRLLFILLPDWGLGKIATDAYVSGDRCFLYTPIAGEEFNMLVQNLAGTGDDHAIGDLLIVDDSTGKLIATASNESEPFICLETITDPTADTLAHVIYTGY